MDDRYDVQSVPEEDRKRGLLKRRGLIAGAAALVAATVASRATQDVAAQGEALIVGNGANPPGFQLATTTTWLGSGAIGAIPVFRVTNNFSSPDVSGDGIQGFTTGTNNAGSFGRNNELNGVGIWGEAPNGTGAFGDSATGSGVAGSSSSGYGIYGQSGSGAGVYGSTGTGLYGVYGIAGSHQGSGGVVGVATAAGTIGFAGAAFAPATDAGYFTGNVSVFGDLNVTGAKHAVVKDRAGAYRAMYCVEAPESWFEDFGTGSLAGGKAEVALDPEFAQFVHTDSYHVFLSEDGGSHGAHTTHKDATGFTVEVDSDLAAAKGKSAASVSGTFSWRVVAKRKDIAGVRLAKTALPTGVLTSAAQLPKPPTTPKKK